MFKKIKKVNKANSVFSYLSDVFNDSDENKEQYKDTDQDDNGNSKKYKDDMLKAHLTDRIPLTNKEIAPRSFFFKSVMPKDASDNSFNKMKENVSTSFKELGKNIGSWKPGNFFKGYRDFFGGNKLLMSIPPALLFSYGAYKAANPVLKRLGADPVGVDAEGKPVYATQQDKRNAAWTVGLGLPLAYIAGTYTDPAHLFKFKKDEEYPGGYTPQEKKRKDIRKELEKMGYKIEGESIVPIQKNASMFGPFDNIQLGTAKNIIMQDDRMNNTMKYDILNTLNAIPGSNNQLINSTDVVDAAINSGMSGYAGVPLGRIAAQSIADYGTTYLAGKILGVPNPGELAKTIGWGSAGLRTLSALF